jgi:hypothetical protein
MLPSFARAFSSSNLRNSRPSPPIETQIDSDHVPPSSAPRRSSPQRPYTLPPIEHIDSRVTSRSSSNSPSSQQQRRPYSHSVSALDVPSPSVSQSGRKRSHDVAIRQDVASSSEPGTIRSTTPLFRDLTTTSGMSTPSRHPNERPIQDTRRRDSDTVDNENVDHIRCVLYNFSNQSRYASF